MTEGVAIDLVWFGFATACAGTLALARYAPELKQIDRRPSDVPGLVAAGLGVGLLVHAPYLAAPFLWHSSIRLLAIALMIPHVAVIMILLTRFRWLPRMLTLRHGAAKAWQRLVAFGLSWIGVIGYAAPVLAYCGTSRGG